MNSKAMRTVLNSLICIIPILVATGCENDTHTQTASLESSINLDHDLEKVNWELALMQVQMQAAAELHCAIAEIYTNTKGNESDKLVEDAMSKMTMEARGHCAISKAAVAASEPLIQIAKRSGRIPSPVFVFSVITDEDGEYREQDYGPFPTEKDCTNVEQEARRAGLATKVCGQWRSMQEQFPDAAIGDENQK